MITNYSETESDIKFEPHLAKTLEILLPLYIENTIYQALIARTLALFCICINKLRFLGYYQ